MCYDHITNERLSGRENNGTKLPNKSVKSLFGKIKELVVLGREYMLRYNRNESQGF